MWRIALKMLMGDTAKFCGILLGLTFATRLMMPPGAIFYGLMGQTAEWINDVSGVDLWVMDRNARPAQLAAMTWKEPMIVLGDINRLHIRGDIDENDVDDFAAGRTPWPGFPSSTAMPAT